MEERLIGPESPVLVTGANGFIGRKLVESLLALDFRNIRCLMRRSNAKDDFLKSVGMESGDSRVTIFIGDLLSEADCGKMAENIEVIYHLAAGRGEKSHAAACLNSVVTTRNLLDAVSERKTLRRFVNVSSFTVYSNRDKPHRILLDENCPVETDPAIRHNAYSYAKIRQDELVTQFCSSHDIPYAIVRPGVVYGPGNEKINGRVGIDSFGIFLHLGGSNRVPLTFVDNCADVIALAGLVKYEGNQVFNVVDDDLPTSRRFLSLYKKRVRRFKSLYIPKWISYMLCFLWEKYYKWSKGQLPNTYNRVLWHITWKKTKYSNKKIKTVLGWKQRVPTPEGLDLYFNSCQKKVSHD